MKIALIQQNYTVGDIDANALKIVQAARYAHDRGARMAIFAADALSGTPLLGMARSSKFKQELAMRADQIRGLIPDDIEIVLHSEARSDLDIRCVAANFSHGKPEMMLAELFSQAAESDRPIVWVNQVGAQTDTIYYGGSTICYPTGEAVTMPLFEQSIVIVDSATVQNKRVDWGDRTDQLHRALVLGIRDYFAKTGCADACVALSGGIDSAVVVALAAEALGAEHVRTLMLPSEYSSDHSIDDSVEMNRLLGIKGRVVSIAPTFGAALESLGDILVTAPSGGAALAQENMQSRIRLMMTMALANSHSALMLNTSNKSEVAVGYGTLYGDTSGALGVIGDLYKGQVYELARHINRVSPLGTVIPENIITKEPSAELRPDQRDSDSLPDYPTLDAILLRMIEGGATSDEIIAEGFDAAVVKRICRLVAGADFKRHQLPPTLRVSGCSFGYERVYPIVGRKVI